MRTRPGPIPLCLPILALAAAAAGGPFRPDRLPADAAWAMHADLELASATKLGRFTLGLINEELAETTIGELEIRAGNEVRDVTLFGWADEEAGGIVMATMTDAADRLIEHVEARETYQRLEHDGEPIHSWIERVCAEGEPARAVEEVRIYALDLEAEGGRLVLATDNTEALLKAVGVIRENMPSRADATEGEARLPIKLPENAFFFFATTEPRPFGEDDPAAEVSKLADVVTLNVGERDSEGFVNLSVSARTEEEATQVAAVLQGLAALAQMMIPAEDQEIGWLRTLAAGMAFTAEGLHVTAACRFDPDMVIDSHARTRAAEDAQAPAGEGTEPPQNATTEPADPKEDVAP